MRFPDPPRRMPRETLLPMINVVFLLLIFFLVAARMAPPEPFSVRLPESRAGTPVDGTFTVFLSAESELAYHEFRDAGALAALLEARTLFCASAPCTGDVPGIAIRAHADADGARVIRLLGELRHIGFGSARLVTTDR